MASGLNTIANLLGKVNASNALVVTLDGGTASATKFLAGDGTAAAPSYSFTSSPTTGWYLGSANSITAALGGLVGPHITQNSLILNGSQSVSWTSTGTSLGTQDAFIAREAAGHLFQKNTTNAQRLSVANTYTSSTNYSAFSVDWQTTAGTALVGTRTAAAGTGTNLRLVAQASSAGAMGTLQLDTTGLVKASGRVLQTRTDTAVSTDGNVTYTAAQVLTGWITRTNMGSNRTDAFPTAADLVAGIPGAAVGHSFTLVVNNNDTAQTVTVNGASNGITYEGAATAIAATEARLFLCILTNVTGAAEAATVIQVV